MKDGEWVRPTGQVDPEDLPKVGQRVRRINSDGISEGVVVSVERDEDGVWDIQVEPM